MINEQFRYLERLSTPMSPLERSFQNQNYENADLIDDVESGGWRDPLPGVDPSVDEYRWK